VYCELVSIADRLPRVLEMAMRGALARGGVAVIVIPGEVFLAGAALRAAFGYDGPALVDVATARQELSLPPSSPTVRSRASACTRPGPSCPERVRSSSS
jgi:thiamine pyrophosphate-dependent acetolactate synthase large subunit-like protein